MSDRGRHALGGNADATSMTCNCGLCTGGIAFLTLSRTQLTQRDATQLTLSNAGTDTERFKPVHELQSSGTVLWTTSPGSTRLGEQSGQTRGLFTPDRSLQTLEHAFQRALGGVQRRRYRGRNRRNRNATLTETNWRNHNVGGLTGQPLLRKSGRRHTTRQDLLWRQGGGRNKDPHTRPLLHTAREPHRNFASGALRSVCVPRLV